MKLPELWKEKSWGRNHPYWVGGTVASLPHPTPYPHTQQRQDPASCGRGSDSIHLLILKSFWYGSRSPVLKSILCVEIWSNVTSLISSWNWSVTLPSVPPFLKFFFFFGESFCCFWNVHLVIISLINHVLWPWKVYITGINVHYSQIIL